MHKQKKFEENVNEKYIFGLSEPQAPSLFVNTLKRHTSEAIMQNKCRKKIQKNKIFPQKPHSLSS